MCCIPLRRNSDIRLSQNEGGSLTIFRENLSKGKVFQKRQTPRGGGQTGGFPGTGGRDS